jgi:hypothetical protein
MRTKETNTEKTPEEINEIVVVDSVVLSCSDGKLCFPEGYFEMIEQCKKCKKCV